MLRIFINPFLLLKQAPKGMTCGQILISFPRDQLLSIKGHLTMKSKGLHCQTRAEGREGRLNSLPGNTRAKEPVRDVMPVVLPPGGFSGS